MPSRRVAVFVGRIRQEQRDRRLAAGRNRGALLVLNGHIDVVAPSATSLWRTAPFTAVREGDWMFGRGTGDMKAGLAVILGAVKALRGLGLAPLAPVQLQSVVEEECTGNGALQCAVSGLQADACVVTEPFPGSISVSQVGAPWFHIDIVGLPAHAGDAGEGANAIEAAFPVVAALRRLEVELNEEPPPTYRDFAHPINLDIGLVREATGPRPSRPSARSVPPRALSRPTGRVVEGESRGRGRRGGAVAPVPRRTATPCAV